MLTTLPTISKKIFNDAFLSDNASSSDILPYQEWGQPARKLHPGDVVYIAPEIKHWHGATKDEWFTHVALEIPAEGASNEWCEPVSDEQYNAL